MENVYLLHEVALPAFQKTCKIFCSSEILSHKCTFLIRQILKDVQRVKYEKKSIRRPKATSERFLLSFQKAAFNLSYQSIDLFTVLYALLC